MLHNCKHKYKYLKRGNFDGLLAIGQKCQIFAQSYAGICEFVIKYLHYSLIVGSLKYRMEFALVTVH